MAELLKRRTERRTILHRRWNTILLMSSQYPSHVFRIMLILISHDRPSIQEIRSWGESFDRMMKCSRELRNPFITFYGSLISHTILDWPLLLCSFFQKSSLLCINLYLWEDKVCFQILTRKVEQTRVTFLMFFQKGDGKFFETFWNRNSAKKISCSGQPAKISRRRLTHKLLKTSAGRFTKSSSLSSPRKK